MSTHTTSAPPSESSQQRLRRDSSPNTRHKNSVPGSTSDPISPTRTPSPLLLPSKRWSKLNHNSQTLLRSQCPCVHYHPWCNDCRTLMGWEPPQPIKLKSTKSIPPFGDLKTVVQGRSLYQSPFATQIKAQSTIKKVCSTWRDEQFTRAIVKRSGQLAAWEVLRWQAHRQCVAHGAEPQV